MGVTFPELGLDSSWDRSSMPSEAMASFGAEGRAERDVGRRAAREVRGCGTDGLCLALSCSRCSGGSSGSSSPGDGSLVE